MTRAVVVMGVSGCGKSTVADALAKRLGVPFLEGDDFHPSANVQKMAAGTALDDEDRWPWLDALGAAMAAAASHDGVVTACSALKRSYRDRLRRAVGQPVLFVYLAVDHDTLLNRLGERQGHFMPVTLLGSQFGALEIPAEDEPDTVTIASVDVGGTLQRVLQSVADWLPRAVA